MLYRVYSQYWAGFELTTFLLKSNDCISRCKFNYHLIMLTLIRRASKRNFTTRNKTSLELQNRLTILSKLRIWGPIKPPVYFHKRLMSSAAECLDGIYLIQSYIIIFLNKLQIVENTPKFEKKNLNKTSMANAMGPFRDSRTNVPAEPPLIGPVNT